MRYGFPAISEPSEYWIAIVELGGGWSPKDLKAYCDQLLIPVPTVKEKYLDGFSDKYTGDPGTADGEVALDIQVNCLPPGLFSMICLQLYSKRSAGVLKTVL